MRDRKLPEPPSSLHALSWVAKGRPVAALVIAHGLAEHAGRYARLAKAMNEAGISVYAADHRGHGLTARDPSELGFFAYEKGWSVVVEDLNSVVTLARASNPGLPVFLMGHSMGSVLARCHAIRHSARIAGLILTGAPSDPGMMGDVGTVIAKLISSARGSEHHSPLLRMLTFGSYNWAFKPRRTKYDWLSRDQAEVDAYLADPLCGFTPTAGLYVDLLHGLQQASDPDQLARIRQTLPVLIAAGSADPVMTRVDTVVALFQEAGLHEVTLKVYDGARHELVNETNREEVFADLIWWMKQHL